MIPQAIASFTTESQRTHNVRATGSPDEYSHVMRMIHRAHPGRAAPESHMLHFGDDLDAGQDEVDVIDAQSSVVRK